MIIYRILNTVNNKCYIGQTKKSFRARYNYRDDWWNAHSVNIPLKNAVKKYGPDKFVVEILHKVENLECLNIMEIHYIQMFNSIAPNGYNLTSGGDSNYAHSESSKIKNSISHLGKSTWNKGKKHTDQHSRNISKSKKLKYKTGETKPWNKGLKTGKMSDLSIKKSADAHKKSVLLLDREGNLIKEYVGIIDTERDGYNPSQVSLCCNYPDKYKTHRGMIFKFKNLKV